MPQIATGSSRCNTILLVNILLAVTSAWVVTAEAMLNAESEMIPGMDFIIGPLRLVFERNLVACAFLSGETVKTLAVASHIDRFTVVPNRDGFRGKYTAGVA